MEAARDRDGFAWVLAGDLAVAAGSLALRVRGCCDVTHRASARYCDQCGQPLMKRVCVLAAKNRCLGYYPRVRKGLGVSMCVCVWEISEQMYGMSYSGNTEWKC